MSLRSDLVIRNGLIIDGTGGDPYIADIAISDGLIEAIGDIEQYGCEEIDAAGLLVTPGFVDIHTHYDGQAIWEQRLSPSSGHGVTTVVMGNCGVGFAPCRPEDRARLVKLMEGVEDIPGVVMTEGLTWEWESYPEYLNAVESRKHDINIASFLPHSPLRVYAMGERAVAGEDATEEDLALMAKLTREAMQAGALGFASSRTLFHRSSDGEVIPTVDAREEELRTIAKALESSGDGILQIMTDYKSFTDLDGEFSLLKRIAKESNRRLTLPMSQIHSQPELWRDTLDLIRDANAEGVVIKGQILPRGVGLLFGLELSAHPFSLSPSYQAIEDLPVEQRIALMREPDLREKILQEEPQKTDMALLNFTRDFDGMFEIGEPLNYEPLLEDSISARAEREGISPLELAYELMLTHDGHAALFMPFANYAYGNLDSVQEILQDENVVIGLGMVGPTVGSYAMLATAHFF